jgi:RNA polymerase sigma factor (sigma-70 family)
MTETVNHTPLLNALSRGEDWAFTRIYEQYSRQLLYVTEKITGNTASAEDIVADSFIKILRKQDPFESEARLKSYLFTISQNAALDWLRAEKRHHLSHAEIKYLGEGADEEIERTLIRAELLQTLYEEIQKLSPQYQEIITRSFIRGESLTEISEKMGIAYKTVQNLKAKAVQELRIQLLKREVQCIAVVCLLGMLRG